MTLDQIKEVGWRSDMENAPRDGTEIEIGYLVGNEIDACVAMWSDRPVCMLGPRNGGFPEGWATGFSSHADTNLPLDPPDFWRPLTAMGETK